MIFEIYVNKVTELPTSQTEKFDLNDVDVLQKITKFGYDLINAINTNANGECYNIKCSLLPGVCEILNLKEISPKDAEKHIHHFMSEIQNRVINILHHSIFFQPYYIQQYPQTIPQSPYPPLYASPYQSYNYAVNRYTGQLYGEPLGKSYYDYLFGDGFDKKELDTLLSNSKPNKTKSSISKEYLERFKSAFDDFVEEVNEIYDEYKKELEGDESGDEEDNVDYE